MKKLLAMAVFGLAALAAFAGTCTITHISLVSTDGTHKTFAGQVDNASGANILQHNVVVAFLDSSNNVVENRSVVGCLRSVQNGSSDFFSVTSTTAASGVSTGLARIAFDSTFKVGTTSAQDVTISGVTAKRTSGTSPAALTVSGSVKNISATKLYQPNACVVVRTSAGDVLITGLDASLTDLIQNATDTFTVTITVPDTSVASTVDIWVDGTDSADNPTSPESNVGTTVTTCPATAVATNTAVGTATNTATGTATSTSTNTPVAGTPTNTATTVPANTPTRTPTSVPC